jgi:hypothetical protein
MATLREGPALGMPTVERTVKAPVLVEVTGANVKRCVSGGHVNEVEPWPEGVLGGGPLISGVP